MIIDTHAPRAWVPHFSGWTHIIQSWVKCMYTLLYACTRCQASQPALRKACIQRTCMMSLSSNRSSRGKHSAKSNEWWYAHLLSTTCNAMQAHWARSLVSCMRHYCKWSCLLRVLLFICPLSHAYPTPAGARGLKLWSMVHICICIHGLHPGRPIGGLIYI